MSDSGRQNPGKYLESACQDPLVLALIAGAQSRRKVVKEHPTSVGTGPLGQLLEREPLFNTTLPDGSLRGSAFLADHEWRTLFGHLDRVDMVYAMDELAKRHFRLFADFDLRTPARLRMADYHALVRVVQEVAEHMFPNLPPWQTVCHALLPNAAMSVPGKDGAPAAFKTGMHLVFPHLVTNEAALLHFRRLVLERIGAWKARTAADQLAPGETPLPEVVGTWEDVFDEAVCLERRLRCPKAYKIEPRKAASKGARRLPGRWVNQRYLYSFTVGRGGAVETRTGVSCLELCLNLYSPPLPGPDGAWIHPEQGPNDPDAAFRDQYLPECAPLRADLRHLYRTSAAPRLTTATVDAEEDDEEGPEESAPRIVYEPATPAADEASGQGTWDLRATRKRASAGGPRSEGGGRRQAAGEDCVPESSERFKTVQRVLNQMSPHYRDLCLSRLRPGRAMHSYLANVHGAGDQYCHNKGGAHSKSRVYFVVVPSGIKQHCFCRKYGCGTYASPLTPLTQAQRDLLFPRDESGGASSVAALSERGQALLQGAHGRLDPASLGDVASLLQFVEARPGRTASDQSMPRTSSKSKARQTMASPY